MKKSLATGIVICLVFGLAVFSSCSKKEVTAKYPEKPITLIVNYGGGGSTDLSARALAKAAEQYLGQPVTIVNKAGGSGTTGVIEVQKSAADGYSIGTLTYSPLAIVPHQMEVPYHPEDFKYILGYGEYRYGIAVKSDSPFKTIADLVQKAKADNGMAFSASGFPQPFAMQKIGDVEGVEFIYVPFKSGMEAVTAVLGGHVMATVGIISDVVPFLKSGELRLLASASAERWSQAPDVQTLKEQGYDVIQSFVGIGTPKDVPDTVIVTLRNAFEKAFADPEFKAIMDKIFIPAVYISGDDYEKLVVNGYQENKLLLEKMKQ